jgi:drug/metabolite transporter (DMT)-like permease
VSNNVKGLGITSLGVFIMSLESLFIRFTTIDSITFSFYLGIFMFVSMSATLLIKQREVIKDIRKNSFSILVFCAILMASSNIFFISAIKSTSVANVVLIFGTSALFSSFFAYLLYKERISRNIIVASFFMFIGLFIIFSDSLGVGNLLGNIYALLCTSTFSFSFVLLAKYTKISRVVLTALTGLFLSLITIILTDSIIIDMNNFLIIAIMGLLITPISRVLIGNGTKYINASEVSLLMIIETIMAPIWVWLFLKEIPSSNTFIGGSIIIATLVINSLYTLRKKEFT